MNKLTHRNLETSKLQILLLMLFIHFVAVPGLAQVTSSVMDQPENISQVQQKFSLPGLARYRFNNSDTTLDQKDSAVHNFSSLWTRTVAGKDTSTEASKPAPQGTASLSRFAVYADFGASIPHGDFAAFFDPNISLNVGLEYIATSQFSIEGIFGYHRFSTIFGGSTDLYQLSGNGKFYLVDESTSVRPFVNGGVGAYVSGSGTARFGGNIGAGILFEVTPSFGLQGSYNFHAVNTGGGLRFSTAQGGIRFRF